MTSTARRRRAYAYGCHRSAQLVMPASVAVAEVRNVSRIPQLGLSRHLNRFATDIVAPDAASGRSAGCVSRIGAERPCPPRGSWAPQSAGSRWPRPRFSRRATIVGRLARDCGSTAMVLCMHYCGAAVLEASARATSGSAAAAGEHLSTLAFSEAGSRSQFWAPSAPPDATATTSSSTRGRASHVGLEATRTSGRPGRSGGRRAEHAVAGAAKTPGIRVRGRSTAGPARQRLGADHGRRRRASPEARCSAPTARGSTS